MTNYLIILAVFVIYLVYRKMTAPKVETINGTKLDELLKDKKIKRQFIDVRTPNEFNSRKVKGFKNIPVQSIGKRLSEVDKSIPVVLMCASGHRSMQAARILSKAGYSNIMNVSGGISSYKG